MKLSYRDVLLLIGIIVAMLVVITTIGYRGMNKQTRSSVTPPVRFEAKTSAVSSVFRKLVR